ncbi:hypothetical protein EPIR_1734 [Erwinia piriflorinigrans CFBP 5888]|uniref:Uncharacterized protein n=1 Tax=Erwinia piriflorinigrans CFBP 5888 TaxID=1161919 RepID=V5Z777_9GAMM|nr:hypothetical protein EPIR_1734 [Erwinia piriflorinigrans CFBP 5888]
MIDSQCRIYRAQLARQNDEWRQQALRRGEAF